MSKAADHEEPITVTDKRRIDPETGQVRDTPPAGPAPEEGSAPEASGGPTGEDNAEVDELKATLQRVKAEYDNYRKRALRDQQLIADRAKATVLAALLPVLDDLDRARSHGDLESGPIKAVTDKLTGVLDGLGLAAFGEEGEPFDPALHEAVQHEGDGTYPVVGTVMRRGYRVGEHVVRHAMVGVIDTVPDAAGTDTGTEDGGPEPEQAAESN